MAGPDVLRQLAERAVVAELAAAAAADAVDDHERFEDHVMEAGTVLAQLFAHDPPGVPHVLEAVLTHGPLVRRGDVLAAAHLATDVVAQVADERPAVLHPDCLAWIAEAVDEHDGADPDRVAAAATLSMTVDGITRPGDLPFPDELRTLAGQCTSADLRAGIRVRELHAFALAKSMATMVELLALVEPHMATSSRTLVESIDLLAGEDRVRAEELFACLPTVMQVTR